MAKLPNNIINSRKTHSPKKPSKQVAKGDVRQLTKATYTTRITVRIARMIVIEFAYI